MYKIEKRPSGFLLTFAGFIEKAEMQKWAQEAKRALATVSGNFGVVVDMRDLKPLPADSQQVMVDTQKQFQDAGMQRSAVILANAVTTSQFKRLAKDSGIYAWERYIDASANADWAKVAVAWVKDGKDPDA